jgi:hypothetical protein
MRAILDSGPLIAVWATQGDAHRAWAVQLFERFAGPFYVTEPILTEVAHLTGRDRAILTGLRNGRFLLKWGLPDLLDAVEGCLSRFPHAGLADASLVAVSERLRDLPVLTTDRRHFTTYRRADLSRVPVELPPR